MQTFGAAGVKKRFSSVQVLHGVDFTLRAGEVHALVGENGSGKSTLVNIMSGALAPSSGHLLMDDRAVSFGSPLVAQRQGLSFVYQDTQLFPDLDVATNVAGTSGADGAKVLRLFSRRRVRERAKAMLSELGVDTDVTRPAGELRPADWKLMEIARALSGQPSFLMLDEPTASLDRRDSERVLDLMRRLASRGVGIGFITHRLDEALGVADQVTVLRDGNVVLACPGADLTLATLATAIVGSELTDHHKSMAQRSIASPLLEVRDVRLRPDSAPCSLSLQPGEVLGLTGLAGSGALELARMIAGSERLPGELIVHGVPRTLRSRRQAAKLGIGYIPEDRQGLGLVPDLSVELNIALGSLPGISPAGVLSRSRLRTLARRFAAALHIKAPALGSAVRTLSGGNQQKVLIARWLASGSTVLVIETPTHGVDVGAKTEIIRLLRDFAATGCGVIVASADVPEVLSLADRVAVFNRGEVVDIVQTSDSSYAQILVDGSRNPDLLRIAAQLETETETETVGSAQRSDS